ncbi:DUF1214 domain-containing protein [Prescottella defluvii]|uniref:DUF1214 domain-containing protein n=1 Tax=Prescottella defluvii TaxID=1323361 RepID=UPI0004F35CDE|nr:DUF1214 domain-containing protein [Prescottella defluvii]
MTSPTPTDQAALAEALQHIGTTLSDFGAAYPKLEAPDRQIDTAEGFRLFLRYLTIGIDQFVEHADPAFPAFYQKSRDGVRKYAGDSPAQLYDSSPVSGRYEYEVTGNMRETALIEFTVYSGDFSGSDQRPRRLVASITDEDLQVSDNGDFSIRLSRNATGPNTLALDDDGSSLSVRRYLRDPSTDRPRPLEIRRVSAGPDRPELGTEDLRRGMMRAADFASHNTAIWARWVADNRARKTNVLSPMHDSGDIHTPRGHRYCNGYWSIADGHALIISFTPPRDSYWSFVPMNYWMESLEWRFGNRVYATSLDAEPGPDGIVRLVMAATDPHLGDHLWIDTDGHTEGAMALRFGRCTEDVGDVRIELITPAPTH